VVRLHRRLLDTLREPVGDMLVVIGIDLFQVLNPGAGQAGVAGDDERRAVEVEAASAGMVPPASLGDQPALDDFWLARSPGRLLDPAVLLKPGRRWSGSMSASR
jgi:hypothetical protein